MKVRAHLLSLPSDSSLQETEGASQRNENIFFSVPIPPLSSLFQVYVPGFVAMSYTHLWLAGSIIATLASPFGPAMGARLVNWARHKRLVGPIVCWLFLWEQPVGEGTYPDQRDAEPQVSLDADSVDRIRDALHGVVQKGLRTAGIDPNLTGNLRGQNALLQ